MKKPIETEEEYIDRKNETSNEVMRLSFIIFSVLFILGFINHFIK